MSSLNITVEIKAPRLGLIETQKIKALSCLWQSAEAPVDVGRPLSGGAAARFAFRGPGEHTLHHVEDLSPSLTIIIRENILRMTFL